MSLSPASAPSVLKKGFVKALSWEQLRSLVKGRTPLDRVNGPTNAQADLRLFGSKLDAGRVRVTLYRDKHAWCPYCQKVWLWLEERRVPYRVRKVTMFCYGEKEAWYKKICPSGMLPAIDLDGKIITESDDILAKLESTFGTLQSTGNQSLSSKYSMWDKRVVPLRKVSQTIYPVYFPIYTRDAF
jgi:glutathione S-transferase